MSSVFFDTYKSLYNYYYEVGKNWTSPNQAMPDLNQICDIKITVKPNHFPKNFHFDKEGWKYNTDETIFNVEFRKAYFSKDGWRYLNEEKITDTYKIIKWKYAEKNESEKSCTIL